jgi:hypothetical protein
VPVLGALPLLLPCPKQQLFIADDGKAIIDSIAYLPKPPTFEKRAKRCHSSVFDTHKFAGSQRLGILEQLLIQKRAYELERPALWVKHQIDPKAAGIGRLLFQRCICNRFLSREVRRNVVPSLSTVLVICAAMLESFFIPARILGDLCVGEPEEQFLISLSIVLPKRAQGK